MFLVLKVCRHWYNMCVSERTWAYKLEGRSVTKHEQQKTGIHYRKTFAWAAKSVFSQTMQSVAADAVNPAYTSKCCSNCGVMFQDFDLSTRWVDCDCSLSLDRDHNAAINILNRALMQNGRDASVNDNVAPLPTP